MTLSESKPAVSFIGLGAMGFGMATHLAKEGFPVTGFDIWAPTLEKFRLAGENARVASTPAEAVSGKMFCVCMVATAQQAQAVLIEGDNAAVLALPQGAVLLLCSTVPCAYVQALARQLSDMNRGDIHLIDCPVSGGASRAADGTLSIMAGASEVAVDKGQELLEAMADPEKLYIVKGGIGAGSNMKMCHQVLAANQILSASEALGFACHLGLDLGKAAEEIIKSEGWSWMLENRLPRMLAVDHKPVASAVTIILKDAGIITSEARRCQFATPMTSTAEQVYFSALGRGFGPDDDASIIRLYNEGVDTVGPAGALLRTHNAKLLMVVNLLRGIHLCSAAETMAFADHVGLDLEQVFELCINAAGGSVMLQKYGPEMIQALGDGELPEGWLAHGGNGLNDILEGLDEAIDEAQQRRLPLYLGSQALSLIRLAIRSSPAKEADVTPAAVVGLWSRHGPRTH